MERKYSSIQRDMEIQTLSHSHWKKIFDKIYILILKKKLVKQKHEGQLTCGRYTCVGGSVAQLALAAASAALASAGKASETKEGFIN